MKRYKAVLRATSRKAVTLQDLIDKHEEAARRVRAGQKPKPLKVRLVRSSEPRKPGFYEIRTQDTRSKRPPRPYAERAARTLAKLGVRY